MNYRALFKGEYIAAVEFGDKQPTLTIANVKLCKLEQEDGRQKDKGIVCFKETDRCWVLNRTNAICIAAMFGDETDDWKGKRVTLYATMVRVGKKTEPGIRVKGSPDLTAPISVEVKLPRKKPSMMRLVPTGKGTVAASTPEPSPEPEPTQIADDDGFGGEESAA